MLTQAGIAHFGEVARQHVGDYLVPGLVALIASGDDVHVEVQGHLAIGGAPVERDSLFRIASTTKPITAAATLALADDGMIDVNAPVGEWLPELTEPRVLLHRDGPLSETEPAHRAITPRDILTFTFGFGMAFEMFMAEKPWPVVDMAEILQLSTLGPPDPDKPPKPDTWIARLGSLPLIAQPGERWLYNTGAQVLGVLLARAGGAPLPEIMRTRIFDPLRMKDTAFFAADPRRLATLYRPSPEGLVLDDPPTGKWSHAPNFPDGAAGLVSTVDDLHAFARMFMRGGEPVLTPSSVHAMTSDQLTPEQKARGGLGPTFFSEMSWGYCQAAHNDGSFGWDGGLGSTWRVDPNRDLVVIILTQRMWETSDPPVVHRELLAAAREAVR